jgi:hypothetical protein
MPNEKDQISCQFVPLEIGIGLASKWLVDTGNATSDPAVADLMLVLS